jgi:YgiT-type zinc finger domain-containing protein
MNANLKKCPTYGSAKIQPVKKDLEFMRQGNKAVVPQVECEECQHCGEVVTDHAANQYTDSIVFGQKQRRKQEVQEAVIIRKYKKRLSRQARALIAGQARL